MRVTLARALKEKNRLIGEINRIRSIFNDHNLVRKVVTVSEGSNTSEISKDYAAVIAAQERGTTDPLSLFRAYESMKERLVEIKTAITKANAGAAELLVSLTEAKSALSEIGSFHTGRTTIEPYGGERNMLINHYALDTEFFLETQKAYSDRVNTLQDEIDEYNAKTFVEIPD